MKKILVIMLSLVMILIAGCSKKEVNDSYENNYTFQGENDRWEAKFISEGTVTFTEKNSNTDVKTKENELLTVTYKGELSDLSKVKHLEIEYESDLGKGKLEKNYGEGESISTKTFTLTSSVSGGPIMDENEVIKVTINLDGKEETLELKNVK